MKIAFVSLLKNESRNPPLGLLALASYIKQNQKNVEIRLIDYAFQEPFEEVVKFSPDILCLTSFTSYYNDCITFSKRIRKIFPNIIILIGGPHITTLPESLNPVFDFGIIGQGEKRFLKLLEIIEKSRKKDKVDNVKTLKDINSPNNLNPTINKDKRIEINSINNLNDIHDINTSKFINHSSKNNRIQINSKEIDKMDGVAFWKNEKLVVIPRIPEKELWFDEYRLDYSLLHKNYWNQRFIQEITDFQRYMGIISSIGCPFNCIFCSCKAFWGNIMYRKMENVISEIKELYEKYGVKHIEFYDDLFAVNKERLKEFYISLKKENLLGKITFSCFARADAFDEEMCVLLKRINVRGVTFGFESGSDRILKYIKNSQNSSVEKNRQAILLCKKYGFNVAGGIVTGNPSEKIEDMKKNIEFIEFAKKAKASRVWIQILIPLPATKIWEMAKMKGKISRDLSKVDWNKIQIHYRNPLLLDSDVSEKEFFHYYDIAKRKCQSFIPSLILRTLKKNPKNIFYFALEGKTHLTRFFSFVKQ